MSLRSMTGFGRASGPVGEGTGEILARSVNHRSLDLTVRLREPDMALEPAVRSAFARQLARGKVEVTVRIQRADAEGYDVVLNERLLEAVLARFARLAAKFPVAARLEARDIIGIPQIFSVENGAAEFSEKEIADVAELADRAAAAVVAMREGEGRAIALDLGARITRLQSRAARLHERREEITRSIHANLRERIAALFPDVTLDAGRLEQEAALAADRSDVAEELQRLQAHVEQFGRHLETAQEPVGKKLDFLSQEILRELNTLGSKARDLPLIRDVLEMKSELESIREQIPNIE
jgi:uncharacterized protein (TIGR00255 family)